MNDVLHTPKSSQIAWRTVALLGVGFIAVAVVASVLIADAMKSTRRALIVGPSGEELIVEIADSPALRERGLSGRRTLDSDGLLLIFDATAQHGIWMRGMQLEIDLLWLDDRGRIVALQERAEPCEMDSCLVFTGEEAKARYVLELPGGTTSRVGWSVGDYLRIQLLGRGSTFSVVTMLVIPLRRQT